MDLPCPARPPGLAGGWRAVATISIPAQDRSTSARDGGCQSGASGNRRTRIAAAPQRAAPFRTGNDTHCAAGIGAPASVLQICPAFTRQIWGTRSELELQLLGRCGWGGRAGRRDLHAYQFRLRRQCPVGPFGSPQCPALRASQVLPGDRDGHLALVHDLDGAARQRCPVMVDRGVLPGGCGGYLISTETARINVFRCDVGGRMRRVAGSVSTSSGKSTYDAQNRSAGSLADAVQIDHPFSTVPAAWGSPSMASPTLLFSRSAVTDFLPADGQERWPPARKLPQRRSGLRPARVARGPAGSTSASGS
jgi:hypothetical protein